ncbi:PIN domain-containing protein [Actinokineospora pegani]|uniref:hypothetical protein n=1 Tax=Actinokineospora pegani TaxID=2654637 RepID=UPI001F1AA153|nr:hypothetical protein [Actinokineospora pegani]
MIARLHRAQITEIIRATAAAYLDPRLRSLDAIHLATAQVLAADAENPLHAFVSYDKRLLDAAEAEGMPVAAPGMLA